MTKLSIGSKIILLIFSIACNSIQQNTEFDNRENLEIQDTSCQNSTQLIDLKNDTLTASEASDYIGKFIILKGKVVTIFDAHEEKGKPKFLNIDEAYPDNPIVLVIFEDYHKYFKDWRKYEGKNIIVTGKVETTLGDNKILKSCIKLTKSEQIMIVK